MFETGGATRLPPIMSVEEAVENSSFFTVPPFAQPVTEIGDLKAGIEDADQKILSAEVCFSFSLRSLCMI